MEDKTIWQLPSTRGKNRCPVCGKQLDTHMPCKVMIKSKDYTDIKSYTCDARYCAICKLPFADMHVCISVRIDTGFSLNVFIPDKNSTVESIREMMYTKTVKPAVNTNQNKSEMRFRRVPNNYNVWKSIRFIRTLSKYKEYCPKCSERLLNSFTLIPFDEQQKAEVPGRICLKCNVFYVSDETSKEVYKIMKDNESCKGFFLDGKELRNASDVKKEKDRQKKLNAVANSVVMICIIFSNQTQEDYIITNKTDEHAEPNIYQYTSEEGRELLSACFAEERESKGSLNGIDFTVKNRIFRNKSDNMLPEQIQPKTLTIRRNGGYYSEIKDNRSEIVDLLLYSPKTERYEIIKATYSRSEDYCYTDFNVLRHYVHKYGNPGVQYQIERSGGGRLDFSDLNAESILKEWGYNAAKKDELTKKQRQDILADIIDLGILEVHKIVRYLNFFIKSHAAECYADARIKWEEDRKFVENYKVNPNRFMIGKTDDDKRR